jgi:hypothetical protein
MGFVLSQLDHVSRQVELHDQPIYESALFAQSPLRAARAADFLV